MCQILTLKAGASIPAHMLERTCDINKDGFGFVIREKGKFVIERDIAKNDSKKIGALLDKHKDKQRFLHLRHATVGAVNKPNNHPFVVIEEKGPQVLMMHNGTLHDKDYEPASGDKVTSDTLLFNQRFLQPLTARVWAYHKGKRSPLTDPIFRRAISKEVGNTYSIFVLLDTFGEVLRVNSAQGKEFDWGWGSNDYSFNDQHIRSSARQTYVHNHSRSNDNDDYEDVSHLWRGYPDVTGNQDVMPWHEFVPPDCKAKEISSGWTAHGSKSAAASAEVFEQAHKELDTGAEKRQIQYEIDEWVKVLRHKFKNDMRDLPMSDHNVRQLKKPRDSFLKLAGLQDFESLSHLSKDDLTELHHDYPKAAAELTIDLYTEVRRLKQLNDQQAKAILGLCNDSKKKEKSAVNG